MVNCAVLSCKNDSRRQTKQNSNVTFHRFPKREELLKKWVDALQRPSWEPTIRSFVCSAHFIESSMYFSKSGLRKLTPDAVPELGLHNALEDKPKRRKRKTTNKVIMPYMYVARNSPDDTKKKRKTDSSEKSDRVTRSKKDAYTPNALDSPKQAKLKKRIMNLTKLAKRRRLRCNALYAGLNRIKKKVAASTNALKDLQYKISVNPELSNALESCGVSNDLFKGLWKKEKSYSPEPHEDVEDYFYSDIPDDIESYIDRQEPSPEQKITIYSVNILPRSTETGDEDKTHPGSLTLPTPALDMSMLDVEMLAVKTEGSPPSPYKYGEDMFLGPPCVEQAAACRVCLARGGTMYAMGDGLREVYETLTRCKPGGGRVDTLCAACAAPLARFTRRAQLPR